jgi:hypothetical protein
VDVSPSPNKNCIWASSLLVDSAAFDLIDDLGENAFGKYATDAKQHSGKTADAAFRHAPAGGRSPR